MAQAPISYEEAAYLLFRRGNYCDPETPPQWATESQRRIIASDHLRTVGLAGWQAGKTLGGVRRLKREMYKRGPGDYLACAPTYKLLDKKVLPELKVILKGLADYRTADSIFEFNAAGKARWGFTDELRLFLGYAENPDSLESATYKAVYGDEVGAKAFPEASHHVLVSRLLVHDGPLVYTSRPYQSGWFEEYCKGSVDLVQFASWDNPALASVDWDALRQGMPAWQFAMRYEGRFTKPAGAIYDCFDRDTHVVDDFAIPPHWLVYTGHDFGEVNMAAVYVSVDPQEPDTGYVFDSYLNGGRHVQDHAVKMKRRAGRPIQRSWGGNRTEDVWRTWFRRAGLPISACAVWNIEPQIACVYRQIKLDRLKFFREGAAKVVEEVERYSRELDDLGEPTGKIEDEAKYHRHAALRYVSTGLWPERQPYIPSYDPLRVVQV